MAEDGPHRRRAAAAEASRHRDGVGFHGSRQSRSSGETASGRRSSEAALSVLGACVAGPGDGGEGRAARPSSHAAIPCPPRPRGVPSERRGAAGRGGRAPLGRPGPRGGRAAAAPPRAGPLREPAPGAPHGPAHAAARRAGAPADILVVRDLAGGVYFGEPRGGHRDRGLQHLAADRRAGPARGPRGVRAGAPAPAEQGDVRGQGERAGDLAPVAHGGRPRWPASTPTSSWSTATWTRSASSCCRRRTAST